MNWNNRVESPVTDNEETRGLEKFLVLVEGNDVGSSGDAFRILGITGVFKYSEDQHDKI